MPYDFECIKPVSNQSNKKKFLLITVVQMKDL